jgi:hypothetical protein
MNKLFPFIFLLACGDKTETEPFESGSFQLTNTAVNDQCLDGAFTALFLPEGDGTTHDWQYPIELPSDSELPSTYKIQLQEPFSEMEVTVVSGGDSGTFAIDNATQNDVLFDEANSADCVVDLSISATITVTDNDNVTGQGTMSVVQHTGETCPEFNASPCKILLDFYGKRL